MVLSRFTGINKSKQTKKKKKKSLYFLYGGIDKYCTSCSRLWNIYLQHIPFIVKSHLQLKSYICIIPSAFINCIVILNIINQSCILRCCGYSLFSSLIIFKPLIELNPDRTDTNT